MLGIGIEPLDLLSWLRAKLSAGMVSPQAREELKRLLDEYEEKRIRGIL